MDRLAKLNDLLIAENASQNLVSKATIPIVWLRHIADSAQLLELVPAKHAPWLDLGSGAGFPGLVIAAMRPDLEVILVESRKRRVDWLERAREGLALENCRVAGCRLEDVERFDAGTISARAFAPLDRLLDLA
ncbi:MAG TPA: 16S rRNA (guanine(527)-N(7))-methyltransferase RsmG, partial [Erythrobacter sp.]|nr:16S rRNA (guanine(527)-N(7))-methyltransferase RsmG [Erythrobacter sp.]